MQSFTERKGELGIDTDRSWLLGIGFSRWGLDTGLFVGPVTLAVLLIRIRIILHVSSTSKGIFILALFAVPSSVFLPYSLLTVFSAAAIPLVAPFRRFICSCSYSVHAFLILLFFAHTPPLHEVDMSLRASAVGRALFGDNRGSWWVLYSCRVRQRFRVYLCRGWIGWR